MKVSERKRRGERMERLTDPREERKKNEGSKEEKEKVRGRSSR